MSELHFTTMVNYNCHTLKGGKKHKSILKVVYMTSVFQTHIIVLYEEHKIFFFCFCIESIYLSIYKIN